MYIKYDIFNKTYYAGPYDSQEIESHKRDISTFDGVSNVSLQEPILFYKLKDDFGFCSNFWKAKMFYEGRWYQTVEHLYQMKKTLIKSEQDEIWAAETPRKARDLGQKISMRPDWDDVKYQVMKDALILKFTQHHDLLEKLLSSEDKYLIEASDIDSFWGYGADRKGKNMLGKALMEVRGMLKSYKN